MTVGELHAKLAELVLADPSNRAKIVTGDISRGDHDPPKIQEVELRTGSLVMIFDEEWWHR